MSLSINFKIEARLKGRLGRAGILKTPHGIIETPAFVTVGTKATIKALSPEQVKSLGAQVVLANTYHLYLQPGDKIIKKAGGLHKFMNWQGPTMTDSGGFQVFSLGDAFGGSVSKIATKNKEQGDYILAVPGKSSGLSGATNNKELSEEINKNSEESPRLMKIDEEGVNFKSHIDGSSHRFTPERSIEIQHNIGADMIFAFDECTSPKASYKYQKEAMDRTHRWAKRCLDFHLGVRLPSNLETGSPSESSKHRPKKSPTKISLPEKQALFGIVQGGRFQDLREESARAIASMDFDGFGIGGSFDKEDIDTAVGWVNTILPEDKPRHLLGIGEPMDLFGGIENGVDLFDCVAPTRMARNGTLYTKEGRINISNKIFREDFTPIDKDCECYTCMNYTRVYIAHLFRAKEMFGGTLASIHNLYFIVNLVKKIRQSILDQNFDKYKKEFLERYYKK